MKTFLSFCFALACWFFWEEGGKWVFLTVSFIYFLIFLDKSARYSAELEGRMEDAENNIRDLYEKSYNKPHHQFQMSRQDPPQTIV
jgi:thiosulfate reductase cytochrome b subunit